uniref:Uncharacterized protein n=1 Tax=Arundo donax TaxID=35708 RepID=A0A0A8ZHT9_ARUDO
MPQPFGDAFYSPDCARVSGTWTISICRFKSPGRLFYT